MTLCLPMRTLVATLTSFAGCKVLQVSHWQCTQGVIWPIKEQTDCVWLHHSDLSLGWTSDGVVLLYATLL